MLIVLALLLLLIGLRKGLAGVCFGFMGTLVCLAIAVAAGYFVSPYAVYSQDTGEMQSYLSFVSEPLDSTFNGMLGGAFDIEVISTDGGSVTVTYDGSSTDIETAVKAKAGEGSILATVFPYVGSFLCTILASNARVGATLGTGLAGFVVRIIVTAVIALVLFIILFIIKRVIRRKLFTWLDSNSTPSKIDRLVGAALLLVVLLAAVWTAGYFMLGTGESTGTFASMVEDTVITKTIMTDANVITMILKDVAGA